MRRYCAGDASAFHPLDAWIAPRLLGNRTVSRPEPSSTPERAMELLLERVRLVHGEQDRQAWTWEAREYGSRQKRMLRFGYEAGRFVQRR